MNEPRPSTGCYVCGAPVGKECDCAWEDRFDLEIQDCLVVHVYDTKQFELLKGFTHTEIERAKKKLKWAILQIVAQEMIVANKDGQPTSRLTSLANKISEL